MSGVQGPRRLELLGEESETERESDICIYINIHI